MSFVYFNTCKHSPALFNVLCFVMHSCVGFFLDRWVSIADCQLNYDYVRAVGVIFDRSIEFCLHTRDSLCFIILKCSIWLLSIESITDKLAILSWTLVVRQIHFQLNHRNRFSCASIFSGKILFIMKINNFGIGFFPFILFLIFGCAVHCEPKSKHKTVETQNGQIRGVRQTTLIKKFDYFAFKGIPYAKSPTGQLRFKVSFGIYRCIEWLYILKTNEFRFLKKPPEPIEPWQPRVLDAFEHGPTCMQTSQFASGDATHSENCLFLNVYVPGEWHVALQN